MRARQRGDIERVFPEAKVKKTPSADYRYRASIARERAIEAVKAAVDRIDYDNFKNSVAEAARHDAYLEVWNAMYRYQQHGDQPHDRERKPPTPR